MINPAWFSPGEGPFTVAGKIISANMASLSQRLSKLQVSRTNSNQTRSFVNGDWLIASPSPIAKILAARCCAFPQFHCTANDNSFRYCTRCLNHGYQSAACQISGLQKCPIHNEPLINHCQACGAKAPPYRLVRAAFERPLVCGQCKEPLANYWKGPAGCWSRMQGAEEYSRIEKWIRDVNSNCLNWPVKSWPGHGFEQSEAEHAHLSLAATLIPPPFDLKPFPMRARVHALTKTPGTEPAADELPKALSPARVIMERERQQQLKLLELELPRKLYELVGARCARALRVPRDWRTPSGSTINVARGNFQVPVQSDSNVDPISHGFYIWRLKLKGNLGKIFRGSELCAGVLTHSNGIYSEGQSSTMKLSKRSIVHLMIACLRLDISAVHELNKALGEISYDQNPTAWRQISADWIGRYNVGGTWLPEGLTLVLAASPPHTPTKIYFASC